MTIVGPNPRIRVEPNKPRKWTEPEDKILRALWARGDTAKAIGLVVGRTSGSVLQRAYYLHFDKRSPGPKPGTTNEPKPARFKPSYEWPTYEQNGVTLRHVSLQNRAFVAKDWFYGATISDRAHTRAKAAAKQAGRT